MLFLVLSELRQMLVGVYVTEIFVSFSDSKQDFATFIAQLSSPLTRHIFIVNF